MNQEGVWAILAFTFREAIRTKWLIIFTLVFFLLLANIPVLFLSAAHIMPRGFLSANLNILLSGAFPLIPLLALPIGAISIVDERESGTLQYLLSNPITKSDFFLGRAAGLLLATTVVIFVGFGAAAAVVYTSNATQYADIVVTMLSATLLNAVMLALALIISEFSKRRATAMGIAMFVWFLFAADTDFGTLTYAVSLNVGRFAALFLVLLDPVETSRLANVVAANLNQTQQFGRRGF